MDKILYFSAVGGAEANRLFCKLHRAFLPHADFKLVIYDDTDFSNLTGVECMRRRGYKWPFAREYLHPDLVSNYDYIFIWDDDIDIADFDLIRFINLMKHNHLALAQPSIRSPHRIFHPVVRQQPGLIGRFTNFVEIMVPVYSRDGWRRFHPYLTDWNTSGWGYDYIPIEPRGIVDCMHVVHTRAVSSATKVSRDHLTKLQELHGLRRYPGRKIGELRESLAR